MEKALSRTALKQKIDRYKQLAALVVVLVVGIIVGFRQVQPPAPPSSSDPHYAAYQRLLSNVKAMSVAPHVSGSKEIEVVHSYILEQIKDMGLEPIVESKMFTLAENEADNQNKHQDIQRGQGGQMSPSFNDVNSGAKTNMTNKNNTFELKNILVKIDAPNTDNGILIAAHYDTEEGSPGAADDSVSVAAILETMRKQAKNPNLKNDMYFLLTDGEELGAIGAKAFVASHPELKESINLVVNLDARGSRGGLIMFETSAQNYDLIRYFTAATSSSIAFSFTAELYKHMPNGTDLTDFLKTGYSGLNFAIAEGVENYHQPTDTFENLNRASAYQFLLTAFELSDYATHTPYQDTAKREGVYFPFWPGNIVLLSKGATYFLASLATIAAIAWIALQVRCRKVSLRRITISSGWLVGTVAVATMLSWIAVSLFSMTMPLKESSNTEGFFLTLFVVLAISLFAVFGLRMRKLSLNEAIAGILPMQLLLMLASTIFLYSASYLFILPTLALIVWVVLERYSRRARLLASALFGFGLLLLWVPVCWLLYVLFLLPGVPVVIALSVVPIAILAALFMTKSPSPTEHIR